MDDENFSSFEIPRPSKIVQPPCYYLVVTRGPQVGIFGIRECKEVELERLLSGREYAFRDFEDWRSALKYYRKCFDSDDISIIGSGGVAACEGIHPNSSGQDILHPDSLVEPEGSFLVVTRGHKVGIFNEPGQIDLERLFSTPGYALRHFSYWKPAYRYYKANYKAEEVVLTARTRKRRRPISTDFSHYTDYVSDMDVIPAKPHGQGKHGSSKGKLTGAKTTVVRTSKHKEYDAAVFGASASASRGGNPLEPEQLGQLATKDAVSENLASSSKSG